MTTATSNVGNGQPGATPGSGVADLTALRNQPAPVGGARSEALWARRRDGIISERHAAYEVFLSQMASAEAILRRRIGRVDDAERDLLGWRGQDVVRIRTSIGSPLDVFHRASGACGWSPGRFVELFEAEARARGLRPCSACWH